MKLTHFVKKLSFIIATLSALTINSPHKESGTNWPNQLTQSSTNATQLEEILRKLRELQSWVKNPTFQLLSSNLYSEIKDLRKKISSLEVSQEVKLNITLELTELEEFIYLIMELMSDIRSRLKFIAGSQKRLKNDYSVRNFRRFDEAYAIIQINIKKLEKMGFDVTALKNRFNAYKKEYDGYKKKESI